MASVAMSRRASARPHAGSGRWPRLVDGGGEPLADAALVVDDEDGAHAATVLSAGREVRGKVSSKQVTPPRRA